jgi:hypothetical protein
LADAITREAAWLNTFGDGLPALAAAQGGPFTVVQARMSRTPATRQTALYLTPAIYSEERWANFRRLGTYNFRAAVFWPIGSTTTGVTIAEVEQQALDDALELVVERIRGLLEDHTHGGRFLAVAEAPAHGGISVHYTDPAATLSEAMLRADVLYQAQDEFVI